MKRRQIAVLLAAMMISTSLGTVVSAEDQGNSGEKWSEETTADGWVKVTNEGGTTLGYSPESGLNLIEEDGYAFKDLNGNGELDKYEDWRLDNEERAEDIASKLTVEQVAGLMLFSSHQFSVTEDVSEEQAGYLDDNVRAILSAAAGTPVETQAKWNNSIQAYVEGTGLGIPVNISTDPRNGGTDVSKWPGNLALAATFDPDVAKEQGEQLSKEFRALGITTLLGPQMDLATDPRWPRNLDTYGEDPALSRDLTQANVSGYQSTYDEDGNDLGWGDESVTTMIKHWPGDGMGEGGRESHGSSGKYAVYPGDNFQAHLIPFVDGGLNLEDSSTGSATSIMSSYSIAYSDDEEYGELVGSAFSEYKLQLLRSYGYDGIICSDWGVVGDMPLADTTVSAAWGVEDLTQGERCYKALMAGVDQFGGLNETAPIMEAYQMGVDEIGEDAILERFQDSGRRLLKTYFYAGLFDNPYVDVDYAKEVVGSDEAVADGQAAQLKSIVMLKNDGAIAEATTDEKPTVYVPLVYRPSSQGYAGVTPASAELPVDRAVLDQYFNVVTDTVSDTYTGPEDEEGNPTLQYSDIVRASADELADVDYAMVFVDGPSYTHSFAGIGYDSENEVYTPLSLQYRPYTADSDSVRTESISGDTEESMVESVYGAQPVISKENRSYYGETATSNVETDLDMILDVKANMPEDKKIIVAANARNAFVVSEFESEVDAILVGFNVDDSVFLDIAAGKVEPSGLLPVQFPASMEAVEAQLEDVPRDMECYVDADGNTYDFAFGLNWSGVINDERVEKYNVEPLTEPTAQPVE